MKIAWICYHFYQIVFFKDPKANDGGQYKATAVNELGESNATITLNFQGKISHSWHNH